MSSVYDISSGTGRVQISDDSIETFKAVQITANASLNADITIKLQQSSDEANFFDVTDVETKTLSSGGGSDVLETENFTLDYLYLYVDVGSATLGQLDIFTNNKKKDSGSEVTATIQGEVDSNITNDFVNVKDISLIKNAFGLLEVANPITLFDAQLTYNLQPLLYEQITTGGGTISHDTTNRCADITVSAGSGTNAAYMQTYEYFRYQPGKGQKIFLTFNFIDNPDSGYVKFAQYGDDDNALRLEIDSNGDAKVKIITGTDEGNQEFSVDTAGLGIDWTKEQILVIQFEALYVGSVEFLLQLNNEIVRLHVFDNANHVTYPYIQNANLPIRVGIEGTGACNTSMRFNCCSVQSSGGIDDTVGYPFTTEFTGTASNGSRTMLGNLRPKTTFNGITNRTKFVLDSVDFLVTGNSPVLFELGIGQSIVGASWSDVNTDFSAIEVDSSASIGAGSTTVIYFDGGYVASSNQNKGNLNTKLPFRFPITLEADGTNHVYGKLTFYATGIGGNSACRIKPNWKEIR